ncbi:MAG: amidase [Salaquimonas sp.]|nr:amidase [Salaquimonas sp.]
MPVSAFSSATQLVAALNKGEIGARELLETYLEHIERHDGELNAVVVRDFERARNRAGAIDDARARGEAIGPLAGLPMTVKESFNVEGLPTCWGFGHKKANIAASNSVVVQRLSDAGAVIFGKTNIPVGLADWQSFNPVYGVTINPWNPARSPGGSSGGAAAALAAGLTGLEFGSDIAGSIRVPANFCGVYGLKPTLHLIPTRGHTIDGSVGTYDLAVVGPLARQAQDLELALDLTAGPDVIEAAGWQLRLPAEERTSLGDFRVALWPETSLAPTAKAIIDALQRVADRLAALGVKVDDRARPALDEKEIYRTYLSLLSPLNPINAVGGKAGPKPDKKSARPPRPPMSHLEWLGANEKRQKMRYAWHDFFRDWDVLLCPVFATPAYPHLHSPDRDAWRIDIDGEPHREKDFFFWPALTTLVGLPSVAAPIGQTPDGLPVGIQIVVPQLHEKRAIRFARLLADEFGGFTAPPGFDAP